MESKENAKKNLVRCGAGAVLRTHLGDDVVMVGAVAAAKGAAIYPANRNRAEGRAREKGTEEESISRMSTPTRNRMEKRKKKHR